MNKNDNLYSNIIRGLQGRQPSLEHPDEMINGVMARIKQQKRQRLHIIALRFCASAASMALVLGIAECVRAMPQNNNMALLYLQKNITQKNDEAYFKNKYLKKNRYELIKQNFYENKK